MLAFSLVSYGTEIIISADGADRNIKNDSGTIAWGDWVGQKEIYIGNNTGTIIHMNHIIPFQIPITMSVGQHVTSAEFNLYVLAQNMWGNDFHADLVGLDRHNSSSNVLLTDYTLSSTLLVDNFLDNTTPNNEFQTASGTSLINFINSRITAGAQPGDYIFFRIEDDATGGSRTWKIATADHTGDITHRPTLTVQFGGGNSAPTLSPIGNITATEGIAKSVAISGTDPDSDAVTFSIAGNPTGITLTDNTDGTATIDIASTVAVSVNANITITVSDGSLSSDEIISIEVVAPEPNVAPVLASIGTITTTFGDSKIVNISATDANAADVLAFSISGNPAEITLLDNGDKTATLTIANTLLEGEYAGIIITVTDGSLSDDESITVNISAPLDPNQKMNLDPTTDPDGRFDIPQNLVWNPNVGDANVCLWKGDRIAATTITIDDNIEGDHAWWLSMQTTYDLNFTWFVIIGSVSDWSPYQVLVDAGNEVQAHDLAIAPAGHGDINTFSDSDYLAAVTQVKDTINFSLTNNECTTFAYPYGTQNGYLARSEYIAMRGVWGGMNYANKTNYLDLASRSAINDPYDLEILLDPSKNLWNMVYYRGLASYHYHTVAADKKAVTETFLATISAQSDVIWNGMFSEVTRYGQERDTHTLTVDEINALDIKFTLTDEMNDNYFDFPLTVKIRVSNDWNSVEAEQNGNAIDVVIVENSGDKYVLVDAVPDAGQVTVTGSQTLSSTMLDINDLRVYPNPVNGNVLNIVLAKSSLEQQKVELIGLSGKTVYSSSINSGETKHQISIANQLSKGIYVLRISSNDNVLSKKVIIE